jgi:glycosyltransferase involved in cell wall biosynthesis
LRLANEEYKLYNNLFSLCANRSFIPKNGEKISEGTALCESNQRDSVFVELYKYKDHLSSRNFVNYYYYFSDTWEMLRKQHTRFIFNENDIFLLQDYITAHIFNSLFPECKNTVCAHHAQGTVGNEIGFSVPFFDALQTKQLQKNNTWIFPSNGAIDGFLRTSSSEMKDAAVNCDFKVAYNGYEKKLPILPDSNFVSYLNTLNGYDYVFATATHLYINKGVERIPRILSLFKRMTGKKIHWILVGNGVMHNSVSEAISKYLFNEDYTWYKERFDNHDNIFALFERCDFYILMHHVSVFDLSTLQAMSYGCIPLLSDVDGNRELCGFDNGVLLDPNCSDSEFFEAFNKIISDGQYLTNLKKNNIDIVKNKFNNKTFLSMYLEILQNNCF